MGTESAADFERGWKWWLSHVIVPLLVALIGGGAVVYATSDGSGGEPRGAITFPKDGAFVGQVFSAEGTLGDIPSDQHIWLAVQFGNLLFPKEPEISPDSHWLVQSIEAENPRGSRLSLALLMVGSQGQQQIERWLAQDESTDELAGLKTIAESKRLDTATELFPPREPPSP
jgi:hypothetical protein